jgi:ABC-type branched-subunit amino acid transport system ATPase component
MLEMKSIHVGYDGKSIVKNVSLSVERNEIVCLIGHNGAGKSTLLKSIFGLASTLEGEIFYDNEKINHLLPSELLERGVSFVPQGNRVFSDLTVLECLEVSGIPLSDKSMVEKRVDNVLSRFPKLKSRLHQRAETLSGGEKQMVALGSALMLSPQLLLLDEPSLGLSPDLVSETLKNIQRINADLETAVLIVEQKVREVLQIADRVYVLRNGQVTFDGPASDLMDESKLREVYL